MNKKNITIGLFGFGCVGYGLYEVLRKTPGIAASVKKICIKDRLKSRPLGNDHFTFDKNDILDDDSINVVVELIDDADEAFLIVSEALKKGKAVVSANKKMVAEHFEELLALQKEYNTPLLYEAACCASIPIIRNLEEYYDNDLLESVEGIVNGSTNYILTQTAEKNISYSQALEEAQQKGYAESNPILDTGGFDAKYKLLILLVHAFGIVAEPEDILNIGIDRLGDLEIQYARQHGLKIKLVAHAYRSSDGTVTSFVLPKFITRQSKLYNVDDVYNGVITHTSFAENQFFMGKGAGAYPTASAVLSDISALCYDYKYEYKKLHQTELLKLNDEVILKVLLRYGKAEAAHFKSYFCSIDESFSNSNEGYIIGDITLADVRKIAAMDNVSLVLSER
jgi:homoserine dehydrogenase